MAGPKKAAFALLFDMDGVIIDSNPFHKISLQAFCRQHGHELDEGQLRAKIYGRTNKDWIRNLFGEGLSAEEVAQYGLEKEALFREVYKNDIVAVPGLPAFLEAMHQQGIPMAIATSAPRVNVDFTLEKTGLGGYFSAILDESHVKTGKPHPEIYLNTASALGYPPEKCLVLEDSLAGVEAGLAAGCKVAGITTTHTAGELANTHLVFKDFHELTLARVQGLMA